MNRLHNTIKGSPRVADGELPLHDRKTRAELKDMKWNSKTEVSIVLIRLKFAFVYDYLVVL